MVRSELERSKHRTGALRQGYDLTLGALWRQKNYRDNNIRIRLERRCSAHWQGVLNHWQSHALGGFLSRIMYPETAHSYPLLADRGQHLVRDRSYSRKRTRKSQYVGSMMGKEKDFWRLLVLCGALLSDCFSGYDSHGRPSTCAAI